MRVRAIATTIALAFILGCASQGTAQSDAEKAQAPISAATAARVLARLCTARNQQCSAHSQGLVRPMNSACEEACRAGYERCLENGNTPTACMLALNTCDQRCEF